MFVLDGAKARIAALAMAAATAVPLLPSARADLGEKPKATTQTVEVKAPKKTKKKSVSKEAKLTTVAKPEAKPARKAIVAWSPPTIGDVVRPLKTKADALKVVLATAKKQLGKPYRYGGTGPSSFDCSGFTMFVWKRAGVLLPHNSAAQYNSLPHVEKSKARVGDIVYSPGHVGLYIGDGKMIHSPQTGQHVEVSPIHGNTRGFARPKATGGAR